MADEFTDTQTEHLSGLSESEFDYASNLDDSQFTAFLDAIGTDNYSYGDNVSADYFGSSSLRTGYLGSPSSGGPDIYAGTGLGNPTQLAGANLTDAPKAGESSLFDGIMAKVNAIGEWTEKNKKFADILANSIGGMAKSYMEKDLNKARIKQANASADALTLNSQTNARAQTNKETMQSSAAGVALPQGLINMPYKNLRKPFFDANQPGA